MTKGHDNFNKTVTSICSWKVYLYIQTALASLLFEITCSYYCSTVMVLVLCIFLLKWNHTGHLSLKTQWKRSTFLVMYMPQGKSIAFRMETSPDYITIRPESRYIRVQTHDRNLILAIIPRQMWSKGQWILLKISKMLVNKYTGIILKCGAV